MKNSKVASFLLWRGNEMAPGALGELHGRFRLSFTIYARQDEAGWICYAKLHTLCNFTDVAPCVADDYSQRDDYYCFIGRLSHEKGAKTLIEAANALPQHKLVIIGEVLWKTS